MTCETLQGKGLTNVKVFRAGHQHNSHCSYIVIVQLKTRKAEEVVMETTQEFKA